MPLSHRLRRLERPYSVTAEDGLRPCGRCDNGEKKGVVFRMQGKEPFDPIPTCPACGRETAFVINICLAEQPPQPVRAEPPNDRPSSSPSTHAHDGATGGDTWPHL